MKLLILLLFLLSGGVTATCQTKKLEVVCEVYKRQINWGGLPFFLPDSLKGPVMVQLKKSHAFSDPAIVNILCLSGWILVSTTPKTDNSSGNPSSEIVYYLKREILVSDAEFANIRARVKEAIGQ